VSVATTAAGRHRSIAAVGFQTSEQVATAQCLDGEGIAARCALVPGWDLFEAKPRAHRDEVLLREYGFIAEYVVARAPSAGQTKWIIMRGESRLLRPLVEPSSP
jgi:transketolase